MTEYRMGDKADCAMCGELIEFVGPYWKHIGHTPRHPAVPGKLHQAETDNQETKLVALRQAVLALSIDMHEVSGRPCETCRALSKVLGEPFGCYAYQKSRGAECQP